MITDNLQKKEPDYGTYISGVDPYRTTTGTDSLSVVYIYKRTDAAEEVLPETTT